MAIPRLLRQLGILGPPMTMDGRLVKPRAVSLRGKKQLRSRTQGETIANNQYIKGQNDMKRYRSDVRQSEIMFNEKPTRVFGGVMKVKSSNFDFETLQKRAQVSRNRNTRAWLTEYKKKHGIPGHKVSLMSMMGE
ncbi:MAG: hypothetical protein ACE5H1_08690 [Thermodesulfobacteriota bacterium]